MLASVVRLAMLAYPRRWRRRYGAELEELTLAVLDGSRTPAMRLRIVVDLTVRGVDERVRLAESTRFRTAATSLSALLAGMFAFGGGLAADSMIAPHVRLSPTVHLGTGVSFTGTEPVGTARRPRAGITVLVPNGRDPLISVSAGSEVVIDTKSGQVTSITRAGSGVRS